MTKRYPNTTAPAVDEFSMVIPAGRIVVFIGPSGCGKTTTMRMINRMVEPTSGVITIGGQDALHIDADQLRRGIGYDADLKQNGLVWLPYSPLNNTYAFGTTRAYAEQHNLRTNSDMAAFLNQNPAEAVFCVETEFASRQDGFPGVQAVYGFPTTEVKTFGTGAIYSSIANGTCNFGEIFTTDGRIAGLDLAVLDDDEKFFPQYNVCVVMREEFSRQHPEIEKIMQPIAATLNNEEMIELGKRVDVDGADPGVVAKDWMVAKGFIGADTA